MKNVAISGVQDAAQMAVGLDESGEHPCIIIVTELRPGTPVRPHWVRYRCSAEKVREIAKTLYEAADLLEGKMVDDGRYDANAETFHEHHHG